MDRLYFITHTNEKYSYFESACLALDCGIKLIQLRMKHTEEELFRKTALQTLKECEKYGARLILNDNYRLAKELGADGVHVGQKDEVLSVVRNSMNPNQIVGMTCNTFEQIVSAVKSGADYIGLGPYRFTSTKENLSPVLGIEGYRNIMRQCRQAGISIPIYAIGGIRTEDVAELIETEIYGIAISSLILQSSSPQKQIAVLRKQIGVLFERNGVLENG